MSAMLEAAARAVATATGYHYSGDSIIDSAEDNPRSAHFVAVARAVMDVVLPIERERCLTIAKRARETAECDNRGVQDWETGEVPCSAERRTGVCECDLRSEVAEQIAARIKQEG
jgi:hypothetical protein